jgi:hypothetical protein
MSFGWSFNKKIMRLDRQTRVCYNVNSITFIRSPINESPFLVVREGTERGDFLCRIQILGFLIRSIQIFLNSFQLL